MAVPFAEDGWLAEALHQARQLRRYQDDRDVHQRDANMYLVHMPSPYAGWRSAELRPDPALLGLAYTYLILD
jgi:hypothetical protein